MYEKECDCVEIITSNNKHHAEFCKRHEREMQQRRKFVWYNRWKELYEHYEELGFWKETIESILEKTHELLDSVNGYGYAWHAWSSEQSLRLICSDKRGVTQCKQKVLTN